MNSYWVFMVAPPYSPTQQESGTQARQNFMLRLECIAIRPAAREYYIRWAETWAKARG